MAYSKTDISASPDHSSSAKIPHRRDVGSRSLPISFYLNQQPVTPEEFGAIGDGVTDDTVAIQRALDTGRAVHLVSTYGHTFNEINDGQLVYGEGNGSGFRQISGIRYVKGGKPTGSYGLSCKSGISSCALDNFEYDGNFDACVEYQSNYSVLWRGNRLFKGRIRQANIAFSRLFRNGWIPPKNVFVNNVRSFNAVRNCFIFQLEGKGIAHVHNIVAENSHVDHLIYSDTSDVSTFSQVSLKGFAHHSMIVNSGGMYSQVVVRDIQPNPIRDAAHNYQYETKSIVHDRADIKGSQYDSISVKGNLKNLSTESNKRYVFHLVGRNPQIGKTYIENTSVHENFELVLFVSSSAKGIRRGQTINTVDGFNLPGKSQLYVHDPDNRGRVLQDVSIKKVGLYYYGSQHISHRAIVEINGKKAENVRIEEVVCRSENNLTIGVSNFMHLNLLNGIQVLRLGKLFLEGLDKGQWLISSDNRTQLNNVLLKDIVSSNRVNKQKAINVSDVTEL